MNMRTSLAILTGLLALSTATPYSSPVKQRTKCSVKTTTTSTEYFYYTTGSVGSTENYTVTTIVDADTLTPTDGTATATLSTTSTILTGGSIQTQTTTIFDYVSTRTLGRRKTITAPIPTGFLPVQSTLPNATYCKVITVTETATFQRTDPPTYYTTVTDTLIESDSGQAFYTATSDFTDFSIIFTTATYIATAPTYSTKTVTSTFSTPITITASTTTVYPACATNNFANVIAQKHSPRLVINSPNYTAPVSEFFTTASDPSACCALAQDGDWDGWSYAPALGVCNLFFTGEYVYQPHICSPDNTTLGVFAAPEVGEVLVTVGNAGCGHYTYVIPGVGPGF